MKKINKAVHAKVTDRKSGEREWPELVMKESIHVKLGLTSFEGQVHFRNVWNLWLFLDLLYEHIYVYDSYMLYILTYILTCGKEMKDYIEYLFAFKNDFAVDMIFYTVKFLLVAQAGFQLCIAKIIPEDDKIQFCSSSLTWAHHFVFWHLLIWGKFVRKWEKLGKKDGVRAQHLPV